ncbi:MAG: UbiA family prenyltransferase [Nannocystaceae bacterium]|nr:UbiA family prenyltransferase [bacterium]
MRHRSLSAWVNQIRPHQLVHQCAVLVVMSGFLSAPGGRIASAAALAVLGTLAMLLLSDYQHRHDDAAMGRRRLVQHLGPDAVLRIAVAAVAALLGFAVAIGGLRCLAAVVGVAAGTGLYTIAKKRRRAIPSYLGRFVAGVMLVETYAATFPELEPPGGALRFALAAGALDVAGNLAGDLRDVVSDRRAGLRTLPLLCPPPWTRGAIAGLVTLAHVVMLGELPTLVAVVSWGACAGAALFVLPVVSRRYMHAAIHGPKLACLLALGCGFERQGPALAIAASVMVAWAFGYAAYLWSAVACDAVGQEEHRA